MDDLRGVAIRGGFTKVCAQVLSFFLRMGALMVLARLLEPTDFGLVAMVTTVTGVFTVFKEFGLSTATVQRETINDELVSTLFWINILVGTALAALSVLISPLLVMFYHEPRLIWVTAFVGTGFVLNAAGVQHAALLQRQMCFVSLSAIDIISLLASIAVALGWLSRATDTGLLSA